MDYNVISFIVCIGLKAVNSGKPYLFLFIAVKKDYQK